MTQSDILFIAAVAANMGDVLTTHICLKKCGREANPILAKLFANVGNSLGLVIVAAAKAAICYGFYLGQFDLGNVGMLALGLYLTVRNYRIYRRIK